MEVLHTSFIIKAKLDFEDIDLVVVYPPRSGLGLAAISNILEINPKKIIYVSCVTLISLL